MINRILEFIKEINPYEEVDETVDLIEEGILDSLTLMVLINEIEEEYNIKIPEEKLQPENFENVKKIVDLIEILKED